MKPLFLVDVDGPLNPFRQIHRHSFTPPKVRKSGKTYEWKIHTVFPEGWPDGLRVLLSRDQGEELAALQDTFDLVWATTWRFEANAILSPLLGLPQLPVIDFPTDGSQHAWARHGRHRGSWKIRYIAEWLDEHGRDEQGQYRPWAFADDETNRYDNEWLRYYWNEQEPRMARKLLHIEASRGLSSDDFRTLRKWAQDNRLH